jgi:hypothetical protein
VNEKRLVDLAVEYLAAHPEVLPEEPAVPAPARLPGA